MIIPLLCSRCRKEFMGDEFLADSLNEVLCKDCKSDGEFLDDIL